MHTRPSFHITVKEVYLEQRRTKRKSRSKYMGEQTSNRKANTDKHDL